MKLEAVNPRNPGELCVASVVSVKGRLMWLHLEGTLASPPPREPQGPPGSREVHTLLLGRNPCCLPFAETDAELVRDLQQVKLGK